MKSRLPSFDTTCLALKSCKGTPGLQELGDGLYSWNCVYAHEAHNIPPGFSVLTLREFVSSRVRAVEDMLDRSDISFRETKSRRLIEHVRKNSHKIILHLPALWTDRFKTCTAMYRSENDMQYVDLPEIFRTPGLDYTRRSDGGASVTIPFSEKPYSTLSVDDYLGAQGGNKSLGELEKHIIVRALIPDTKLRKSYLNSLGIIDMLGFDQVGMQSLWAPGEMKPGYLRWFDLGFKAVAIYPPNCTTTGHRVILRKTSSAGS